MEASWRLLGGSWRFLGGSFGTSGSHLGDLGGCWRHLGASWSGLGASWKGLGSLLGGSWTHFGGIWEPSGDYFGVWEASSKGFVEILKNHEKHCKVLQKSRFRGSVIDGQISLEGKFGRLWTPSLHIRGHVGAKMAKLTLLGGLRSAKLAYQRASWS